jgi:predicted  nucleic acid-binding Zn ribbon protein
VKDDKAVFYVCRVCGESLYKSNYRIVGCCSAKCYYEWKYGKAVI